MKNHFQLLNKADLAVKFGAVMENPPLNPDETPASDEASPWPDVNACLWCREPLLPGEALAPYPVMTPVGPRQQHFECGLRSVVGGYNHLMGRCSCCGGDQEPDPPFLSRRMAAKLAAQVWIARNPPEPEAA